MLQEISLTITQDVERMSTNIISEKKSSKVPKKPIKFLTINLDSRPQISIEFYIIDFHIAFIINKSFLFRVILTKIYQHLW